MCGANANEIQVLENIERLNSLHAFGRMSKDDVTSLASRLEKRPGPNNISLPTSVVKNLQGLCFWASKARRQRRDITAADFDQVVLSDALDEMEIKAETDKAPEIKPEILKEEIWEDWSREFPTYLSHIIGKQQAPLDYVIRPEIQPGHVFQTLREQELYTYPLTGPFFHEDNKAVYRLLSDRVRDQPATWIQPYQASQNGRAAWLALVAHYDGGGQKEKRINKAEAILSSVFYHNERAFSFDAYSTKLLRAFRTLEETPNRRSNANQVKILLDNIRIATAEFAVIKSTVRSNYRSNLDDAIAYISREVSELYPNVIGGSGTRPGTRHRFISETHTGEQSPASRPRNFAGLQQHNGIFTFYGVDVTDVSRRFTSQEMATLGPAGQAYIHQERARLRSSGDRGGRGGGRGRGYGRGRGDWGRGSAASGRGIGNVDVNENNEPPSVITDPSVGGGTNGHAAGSAAGTENPGSNDRGSTNGRRFGAGAYE